MSFLPSVECDKFKLKKTFQSGKILACTKKSEICSTSTLKLIKMMLKCQIAQASSTCMLHWNLITRFQGIFAVFCFVPWPEEGEGHGTLAHWHNAHSPKYAHGRACLNGHSMFVTA